jgi:peptidyl-dipeptidase Dcp
MMTKINTQLKRTLLSASLVSTMMTASAAVPPSQAAANPLLQRSGLLFSAPDFRKIKTTDYLPAIQEAIRQQRAAIKRITANKKPATFANTILALEKSGELLDRVTSVFYGLASADRTPEIAAIEKEATPMLTDLQNEISFDAKLFARVKYVYRNEYKKLKGEDKKLLDEVYKDFVRSGALLPAAKKERMMAINKRISALQQEWGTQLPAATNDAVVWVQSREELAGLSEADVAHVQERTPRAEEPKPPIAIVIINTHSAAYTHQPRQPRPAPPRV